ncbi:MAG: VOC family protein, partial [Opitutaceae bacterium]
MRFEHFALNVPDAASHAAWYVRHLGFRVARRLETAPFTHFLADDSGRVVMELYTNPAAPVPDYARNHPLVFHAAVVAADARAERVRRPCERARADARPASRLTRGGRTTCA